MPHLTLPQVTIVVIGIAFAGCTAPNAYSYKVGCCTSRRWRDPSTTAVSV